MLLILQQVSQNQGSHDRGGGALWDPERNVILLVKKQEHSSIELKFYSLIEPHTPLFPTQAGGRLDREYHVHISK